MKQLLVLAVVLCIFENIILQTFSDASNEKTNSLEQDYDYDYDALEERRSKTLVPSNPKYVEFYSYPDRRDPKDARLITIGYKDTLFSSGLVPGQKVTIITHGFYGGLNDSDGSSLCGPLRNVYLASNLVNIVCVDWSKLSTPVIEGSLGILQYLEVIPNLESVGRKMAQFIEFLMEWNYITGPEMIHLVGHSLGAHVSGVTGKFVFQRLRKKVHRITGLDPAGPIYYPFELKLSKSDAVFVDCIHTNIELYGGLESLGHADFFANGGLGKKQPGCEDVTLRDVFTDRGFCGHGSAITYYARTIPGEKMIGCRCLKNLNSQLKMQCSTTTDGHCWKPTLFGEYGSETARGNYYITVND